MSQITSKQQYSDQDVDDTIQNSPDSNLWNEVNALFKSAKISKEWYFKTVGSGSTDTIAANETVKVGTSSGAVTLTSNLSSGEAAEIIDGEGALDDNGLTIDGNGTDLLLPDGTTHATYTFTTANLRILLYHSSDKIVVISATLAAIEASGDQKDVKVSSNDSAAGFLINKLLAGTGMTITEKNDSNDEELELAANNIKSFEISEQNDQLIITRQDDSTVSVPITQSENNTELVTKEYFEENITLAGETGYVFTGEYDSAKKYYNNSGRRDIAAYQDRDYEYVGKDYTNESAPEVTFPGVVMLDTETGLNILDVDQKSSPEKIFQEGQTRNNVEDIGIVNGYTVILSDNNNIMTISQNSLIDDDGSKEIIQAKTVSSTVENINFAVHGSYVYVMYTVEIAQDTYANKIQVYSVDSNGNILEVQLTETNSNNLASNIFVSTSYIIAMFGPDNTLIEIMSNDPAGTISDVATISSAAIDVAIDETNSYLFALERDDLFTYDISDMSSISQVASSGTPDTGNAIIREGDYLYVGDYSRVYIYDISTRTSLNIVGSFEVPSRIGPEQSIHSLEYNSDYVYITCEEYFCIADVTTKSDPSIVVGSETDLGGDTRGIIFDSDYIKKWIQYTGTIDSFEETNPSVTTFRNQTIGSSVSVGDIVYWNTSNTQWESADASALSTCSGKLGYYKGDNIVTTKGRIAKTGYNKMELLYLSTTAGAVTNTQPSSSGNVVRIVGYAIDSETIMFEPEKDYIEVA